MTATLLALPAPSGRTLHERLLEIVRPEFRAEVVRVAADDPVFGRGACDVDQCRRSAWTRRLCHGHYLRWRRDGKPDPPVFAATTGPIAETPRAASIGAFDLRALRPQARLEVAYVIQCRQADRAQRLLGSTVRHLVGLLADADADSLLDVPLTTWLERISLRGWADPSRTVGLVRYAWHRLSDLAEAADAESEFARDTWRVEVLGLGVHTVKGTRLLHFDTIAQPWLRAPLKRFARFRLATGKAFSSVDIDVRSVRWLSRFLAEHHPEVQGPGALGREVIEHYLAWFVAVGMAGHTTNTLLVCLRGFLDACRRFGWMPGLPAAATIYLDELPRRPQALPRFVPEFVMAQINEPANLSRLPDDTTRHLLVVIIETGLRANDACTLAFNPIVTDSVGWPCLRFFNHKMAAEQLVPLSATAADAIRAQQAHLRERWPESPAVLFPSPHCNPDGVRPFSYATFRERLARWQRDIGLCDETGQAVTVTAHLRHTLGTRLINAGVAQHVVQKMLGHASPQMTARCATLHDATVRAAFDDYQRRRVDSHGQRLGFDPDAPAADAEWVKHNLARVAASLPNGYCGRPPQQDCPHPNACLTCPDFQTTPQFLPLHRRQRDDTLVLVIAAEQAGKTRLADNHRQVVANLERVIAALETVDQEPTDAR